MVFTEIKTKQKIIKKILQFGLKKNEEGISVVKRIKTSVYGDYESDFAGEWQIIEWKAQVSPI